MPGSHQWIELRHAANRTRGGKSRPLKSKNVEAPINVFGGLMKRVNFEDAKRYVHNCVSTHAGCKASTRITLVDLWVLDCHHRVVVPAPSDCKYVALSYVWGPQASGGGTQFPRLPDNLPRTIEDSIEATNKLGCRYLWVDRYCIDQNNSVAQQHQINQMGDIYSGAQVTLVAAAGTGATYGLPGVTSDFENPFTYAGPSSDSMLPYRGSIVKSISESVWYTRAWTYQEGYLSRRRMYFTDVGAVCLCDENRHKESFSKISASLRNTSTTTTFGTAVQMMREYTKRHLTNDHDALNAVLGALETQDVDHIWGVNVAKSDHKAYVFMHWKHSSPVPRRKGFPSWSPIGWRGQVDYEKQLPSLSHNCSMEVWHNATYAAVPQNIGRLRLQHQMPVEEHSKFLRLTTQIVMLEFIQVDNRRPAGLYVKVPYNPTVDLFIYPFWDVDQIAEPDLQTGRIELPCVVVLQNEARMWHGKDPVFNSNGRILFSPIENHRFEDEMQIIILQQHVNYYERIGCFSWEPGGRGGFACDKQGREVINPMYISKYWEKDDSRYWRRNGVQTTFLLG
ncbi:heterokaryon incompatibility protein-domain-containing protein [Alternaria rosae]|uniref:heterokaryon incompatibility protein-domain-containing protein n=1 Tax=Alternaria rosae TaxID=1187941 RepID=UPI001E8D6905|nr:heterokaryon incompatibility protein-domain-containing protein [Alternaria rosae]KAH6858826.1 heterokaryon incompatibility protein-domain-containing protein [Alternaria rosae]